MKATLRFVLLSDNDGHWYAVPVSMRDAFELCMNGTMDEETEVRFERQFGKYRLGGNPSLITFENPKHA